MEEWLPQEIEVRYIIPAIRGNLAKILVGEKKFSQKEAARLLKLSEAAVSQYLHSKRGTEVMFSEKIIDEIRNSAERIIKEGGDRRIFSAEIYRICGLTNVKQVLCDIHRKQSSELEDCNICFEEELIQITEKR